MLTDPIADMFVRIKNGLNNREEEIILPSSNIKTEILRVLQNEGYIAGSEVFLKNEKKFLKVRLKYDNRVPAITQIKRISKPGLRIYSGYKDIRSSFGGLGTVIVSTPLGMLSAKEAKSKKIGGEVICEVY